MIAPAVRGIVPVIVGSVVAQSAIAGLLIARGNVALPHLLPHDMFGALSGIACGALLHVLLPAKATRTLGAPRRLAILQLGLLLASVAVAEEIIWRGFVFSSIRMSSGSLVAFVATTVGFAAMHTFAQGWSGMRNHAVTGAGIGLVFLASGSLLSAIAVHVSYNLLFLRVLQPQRQRP